ncbi:MAG: hypothetical protein LBT36_03945 [Oscillospiraceae bacterium]|jgi:YbbR domain-containing protein|nr:hypothetical protein [Oscillospiraceae bacterium]
MKEKSGKFFQSKTFYIIFSLLASVALWAYVRYIENPDTPWTVTDVPVEFINAELVTDRQLVITNYGVNTVTIRYNGRRSAVSSLNNTTVRAVVDLSQVASSGQSMLRYTEVYADGVSAKDFTVVSRSDGYITVSVEELFKKEVIVEARTSGNLAAEGYRAEPAVLSPETVTVQGPQSVVKQITSVRVDILRENLTKTVTDSLEFTPIDAEGDEAPRAGLTYSTDRISVTVPVRQVKEMTLEVKAIYGAGATEENTVITIEPESVTLSGDAEALLRNNILLATIDLTQFVSDTAITKPIAIPDGAQNLTGVTEATIQISIKGLDTKRLTATDIQIANATEGYTAALVTTSLDVTVRGKSEDLTALRAENLRVVADLSELGKTAGTYTVPARVYLDGSFGDAGAIGAYQVTVRVTLDG